MHTSALFLISALALMASPGASGQHQQVSQTMTDKPSTSPTGREAIARELALYVGKTIELAGAGLPYQEVIKHIGKPPPHHQKALQNGEGAASLYPTSALFSEMTFYLGSGAAANRIVSMEFIAREGSFNMNDMAAAFGPWRRSPEEPEEVTFAVAWFPKYDKSSGARMFLYAEDGNYTTRIDPAKTPKRLFIQTEHFRWE